MSEKMDLMWISVPLKITCFFLCWLKFAYYTLWQSLPCFLAKWLKALLYFLIFVVPSSDHTVDKRIRCWLCLLLSLASHLPRFPQILLSASSPSRRLTAFLNLWWFGTGWIRSQPSYTAGPGWTTCLAYCRRLQDEPIFALWSVNTSKNHLWSCHVFYHILLTLYKPEKKNSELMVFVLFASRVI